MIEVKVETVQASWVSPHRVLVLKELDTERYLPIWIGGFEADAISMRLLGQEPPRPLTHDLLVNLMETLNAGLAYIYISSLTNNTFYARLVLQKNDKEIEMDSRTSDAVAIAVRCSVPIYVHEDVMQEAGVEPELSLLEEEGVGFGHDHVDQTKDLGAFRDFLNTLNMEDMDLDS